MELPLTHVGETKGGVSSQGTFGNVCLDTLEFYISTGLLTGDTE